VQKGKRKKRTTIPRPPQAEEKGKGERESLAFSDKGGLLGEEEPRRLFLREQKSVPTRAGGGERGPSPPSVKEKSLSRNPRDWGRSG